MQQRQADGPTPGTCRAYEAPSEDLLEAVQALVRYMYVLDDPKGRQARPALAGFQWLPDAIVRPAPPAAAQPVIAR